MEPYIYYQDDHCTLWHGDCRDVLPRLALPVDLVLTDPPYGIPNMTNMHKGHSNGLSPHEREELASWNMSPPDAALLASVVASGRMAVVWGANYMAGSLGAFRVALVWDKVQSQGTNLAGAEIAWTNFPHGCTSVYKYVMTGATGKGYGNGHKRQHPTQKPVAVMAWCLRIARAKPGWTVLDPFAGSGTTALAARAVGVAHTILVEKNERYCGIIAARLAQEPLPLDAPGVAHEQMEMIS